jgi:hypothetical protein
MADIIAIIDETQTDILTATTGTGSALSDGGLPLVIETNSLINPGGAVQSISDIGNVDTTTLDNGAVLVYRTTTNRWTSTTTLEAQNMEGGEF